MATRDILGLEQDREANLVPDLYPSILSRGKVRTVIAGIIRNNPIQLLFVDKSTKYLNVGCGGNVLRNFINIDYGWCRGQEICWNILKGLPIASGSIKGIFIEHTIEHFTMAEIQKKLLPEFMRVLEPAGTIRVSVPDAEQAVERYNKSNAEGKVSVQFEKDDEYPMTPMMYLNNTFRQNDVPLQFGHKFAFDYQTLEYFLGDFGFVDIRHEQYMEGRDERLLVDYKRRADESLYVEASKPGS